MQNELIAEKLEAYNKWRRGDDSINSPYPKQVGGLIDRAIEILRHDAQLIKEMKKVLNSNK